MILITGGTGFVGTNLIRRMRKKNLPVRALVRNPDKARPLKDLGVELVQGDIADKASLEKAAANVERVVHLVGIIQERRGVSFQDVHVDGTRNVLDASQKAGVLHFFYQSALGTRANAVSMYHKTKWQAEELVRSSTIPYTILRPSLIYGPGDLFTVRVTEMIKLSPVLPVIGSGTSKIQPIFIDDVVACILKAVTGDSFLSKTYEIGGPEQLTYEAVFRAVSDALNIHRTSLHIPLAFMRPVATILGTVLPRPPLTTDQLTMLQEDNVCGMQDIRDSFGIDPIGFQEGLKRFLRASP
jgi:uncharacterized protein YbjT (DUF2867 family)